MTFNELKADLRKYSEQWSGYDNLLLVRSYREKNPRCTISLTVSYLSGGFWQITAEVYAVGLPPIVVKPRVVETKVFKRIALILEDYIGRINNVLDARFFTSSKEETTITHVEDVAGNKKF